MSKRQAADYITKTGEGSMSAPPSSAPRTATAAQMAQRKLKAPRGRLHSGVSSTGSSSFSSGTAPNLFGQIGGGSNPFSTPFGNSNNTPASNLSVSASFPPSKPSTINFAPAPPSGSFTFEPQNSSNPFANLGNDTGNNKANKLNFGGFGAQTNGPTNSQSDGDTMMESPQKKPPAFGTIFGGAATATTSAAPFLFGQSSRSNPTSGFGASAPAQPPNNIFNFGQSQPAGQTGSLFGFGAQKPEEPKPQASMFGQSSSTSQPTENPFGQPASPASSSNLSFGQSNSTFNPASGPFGPAAVTSSTPANIFGSSAPATQVSSGGPVSTLFGQAPATIQPPTQSQTPSELPQPAFSLTSSTSHPPFSISAVPVPTSNTTSSNVTPQAQEGTPVSSASGSAGPIFSRKPNSTSFSDIFKSNEETAPVSAEVAGISSGPRPAKSNPFTFKPNPPSSQPSFSSNGGLFGPKPSESNISGGLFGRTTRSDETASTPALPATLQNAPDDEHKLRSASGSVTNPTNIFGKTSEPEQIPQPVVKSTKPQETPSQFSKGLQSQPSTQQPALSSNVSFGNFFGASLNKNSSVPQEKPRSDSSFNSSLFTKASAAGSHNADSQLAESQVKQHSWPGTKPTPLPAKSSPTGGLTPSTFSSDPAAPKSTSAVSKISTEVTSESDIRLRSYGSSAIPGYLDNDESVEHDSLSRLRNLNTSFQKNIAKLDPATDDFEEIVRHYVAQRARIGHSLNLKERNKAGMKRKVDNDQANEEQLNGSKKARTEAASSEATNAEMLSATTDSSNTSATIQPPNPVPPRSPFKSITDASNTGSSSATSSIFKNIMSPAPTSSTSLSTSSASHVSSNSPSDAKISAPSSSNLKPRTETAAASLGTANESVQSKNPFASFSVPSSTGFGSAPVASSTPIFKAQVSSTTPAKSPPKKPVFEVPQFGGGSRTSFMDAFAKQSAKSAAELQEEAKRKRKAEEFDSDEDDEAEWERKYEEEERAKRKRLESLSKSTSTGFQPLFGGKETSATAKTFFNLANKQTSNISSSSKKETSSTGFAGFGSTNTLGKEAEESGTTADEDSNGSRSSEEQGESASQEGSDKSSEDDSGVDEEDASEGDHDQEEDDEESEGHPPEDESEDEDIQAAMARSRSKGSLFDRIEPNPKLKPNNASKNDAQHTQKKPNGISSASFEAKAPPSGPKEPRAAVNSSFKPPGANGVLNSGAFTSTPNAPTMSPFTPTNGPSSDTKDPFAPVGSVSNTSKKAEVEDVSSSKKINGEKSSFGSNPSALARSVLFGGNTALSSGTIPGEGLFGSRPSTPGNDEPARSSIFGNLGSGPNFSNPQGDKTYQRGTPLKFGTPNKEGPTVNITAATPPAKDDSPAASKSFPNLFGPKPSKPGADAVASVGFTFGGPTHLTASPLLGPSGLSSAISSRATSPGATDTESVNTDTAEEHSDEPQTSLMISRPGEEHEKVLFEARSKALKFITEDIAKEKKLESGFNTQGVGQLRVLKHTTTGKTRLLLRAEPGSNIVINTSLNPSITYKATETKGSGAVKFGVPTATGIDHWVAKVKTAAMAEELAGILEANKGEMVQN